MASSAPAFRTKQQSYPLLTAKLPEGTSSIDRENLDPDGIVQQWLHKFHVILKSQNLKAALANMFLREEAYWRDQLCLSWDFHTLKNIDKIADFLSSKTIRPRLGALTLSIDSLNPGRRPTVAPVDIYGKAKCVTSFLEVKTDVGRGTGVVRLCKDPSDGQWKAFTLFTSLAGLKGHPEATGEHRGNGVKHGQIVGRKNWKEAREAEVEYERNRDPVVLIIGAGQAGLTVAARLKLLGVDALIIEKNERIGDNWRKRYHQLVLHDPVWYDHLPYMPFPSFWPKFVPKDKLGDWFETYAMTLELNAWLSTTPKSFKYDDNTGKWAVAVERIEDGKKTQRTFHPRYVIQCTGASGEKSIPSSIIGMDSFKGSVLCHSSEFPGARPNGKGRRAVIVGSCNSGHDIAQDFVEKGYDVTMIQRSTTFVASSEATMEFYLGALYSENGPPTEEADLIFASLPAPLIKRIHIDLTAEIAKKDANLRNGLKKAGFGLDSGPDKSGLFMKYLSRGGGYYIDVGASKLIIEGRIKMKQGVAVKAVESQGLRMADGSLIPADEIVFATGYGNMRDTTARVFGKDVARRVKDDIWGFDKEGELRTIWRPSGHPGLFFMGGNLALCRFYSRLVALQIKAQLTGLNKERRGRMEGQRGGSPARGPQR